MGIIRVALRANADHFEHLQAFPGRFAFGAVLVQGDDLRDLVAHAQNGVERGHGVLKDHGYLVAADLPQFRVLHLQDVPTIEQDLAGFHNRRRRWQQAQDGKRRGGFSGAGLAHQAKRFALFNGQIDPVDRLNNAGIGFVMYG